MKYSFVILALLLARPVSAQHQEENGMETEGVKAMEYFKKTREATIHFNRRNGITDQNLNKLNYQALKSENTMMPESYSTLNGNWLQVTQAASTVGMGRAECIDFDPVNPSVFYLGTAGGGLWKTIDGGNNYTPLTDNLPCGGIADVVVNPANGNNIFILTGAGLSGQSNTSIGVFESNDGGTTWEATGLTDSVTGNIVPLVGYKLIMQPGNPNVLFAGTNFGLYKTIDGGATWNNVLTPFFPGCDPGCRDICDIEFKPGDPSTVYASGIGNFFWISYQNNGNAGTWTLSASTTYVGGYPISVSEYFFSMIAVTDAAPNSIYLVSCIGTPAPGDFNVIYFNKYYTASSTIFRPYTAPLTISAFCNTSTVTAFASGGGRGYGNIYVDDDDSTNIIIGGLDFFASTNTGNNWTRLNARCTAPFTNNFHVDVSNIEANDDIIYVCTDGGVWAQFENYTSSTAFWFDVTGNIEITQPYAIDGSPQDADYYLYGTQDNGVHVRTSPASYSEFIGGDGTAAKFNQSDKEIYYGTIQNGEFFSKYDHTVTTGIRVPGPSCNCPDSALYSGTFEFSKCFMLDENNSNILYYMKRDFYYSPDAGATWIRKITGQTDPHTLVKVAKSNSQVIYALKADGYINRSTNQGTNWNTVTKPFADLIITDLAIDKTNSSVIYITCAGNVANKKFFKSTDGGVSAGNWTNLSTGLPNVDINTVEIDAATGDIYTGTAIGVYVRPASQNRWISFNNGLPRTIVKDLYINPVLQTISAGTFGRGIFKSNLFSISVCLPFRNFTGTYVENYTGSALDSVLTTAVIEATQESNVKFTAQNQYVRIAPGFWAKKQSTFTGAIEPCGGDVNPYRVQLNSTADNPVMDKNKPESKAVTKYQEVVYRQTTAESVKQDSLMQAQKDKTLKTKQTNSTVLQNQIEEDREMQRQKELKKGNAEMRKEQQ